MGEIRGTTMNYIFRSLLIIILTFISSYSLYAQTFTNIIIFGDSLSDLGNNTWVSVPGRGAAFDHGAPISNLDPTTHKPTIWPQYLIAMNLFSQKIIIPSTQWQQQSLSTTNVVYAYASAETGDGYLNDESSPFSYPTDCKTAGFINEQHTCVPNLQTQIKTYLANLQIINEKPGNNTLFVIWAGGNDVFDDIARAIYRISHAKENWHLLLPQQELAFSWFPSFKIYRATQMLINAGVPPDHIYVITLPNISITPGAKELINGSFPNQPRLQKFCLKVLSGVTNIFNFNLRSSIYLGTLRWNKPQIIDINPFLEKIIKNRDFGSTTFPHVENSCRYEYATPYCTGYLFFNDKHPTTTAGKVLAIYLYNNLNSR